MRNQAGDWECIPAIVSTYFVLDEGPCTRKMETEPGVVACQVMLNGLPASIVSGMVGIVKAF
jgi:hypothetical protein